MTTHKCPVRGHDHELRSVRDFVQDGTGLKAQLLECPTGVYRWLVIAGRAPSKYLRMKRPRFGWRDV